MRFRPAGELGEGVQQRGMLRERRAALEGREAVEGEGVEVGDAG